MDLLSTLKSRFFPPELCRIAKTGDVAAIVDFLARTSVVVVAADLGDSAPMDADPNAIIAIVEAAGQRKSFDGEVHKYELDGEVFLPVFTDAAAAELFCGAYVSLLGQIHAFRLFRVPGAYVRNGIADKNIIVVNPQSDNEVEIDRSKSEAIRAGLTETDDLNDAKFLSLALPAAGISQPIEFTPET